MKTDRQSFLSLTPMGPYIKLQAKDFKEATTFRSGQPIVGTYYFYWYDVNTKEHFVNSDGSDALTDHPLETRDYSYRSAQWHRREMEDILSAGIDFILPVYWGSPGDREPGKGLYWSFEGLKVLVKAQLQRIKEGKKPPKIGLFYDTSTLQYNSANYHADLRTAEGRAWFYVSIRDFFSLVPPKLWAMVDDRPILFLYAAAFAKGWDQGAMDFVYQHFERDFSRKPYLVRETSWSDVQTDNVYAWGGALNPQILGVAAIGPGYDHSAVPGRTPLKRDREDGKFYERSWQTLLQMNPKRRPWMVMIETWNELHEGTEIEATREYGRQYIELTARYAKRFRKKEQIKSTGAYAKVKQVELILNRQPLERGLRLVVSPDGDGLMEPTTIEGVEAWHTVPNWHSAWRYIYFDVDDSFYFDSEQPLEITLEIWDGEGQFSLEYDSIDPKGSVREGAFKHAGTFTLGNTRQWKSFTLKLSDARFVNRANGADFRLSVSGQDLVVRSVKVSR